MNMSRNILVAYFSASGVTGRVAREIAEATGGGALRDPPRAALHPRRPRLDEQKEPFLRGDERPPPAAPPIAGELPEMDKYDTVFLGFPIWWYVQPRIVDTFLEACDVSGKTIIPFATSGGSGVEGAARALQGSLSAGAVEAGQAAGRRGRGGLGQGAPSTPERERRWAKRSPWRLKAPRVKGIGIARLARPRGRGSGPHGSDPPFRRPGPRPLHGARREAQRHPHARSRRTGLRPARMRTERILNDGRGDPPLHERWCPHCPRVPRR